MVTALSIPIGPGSDLIRFLPMACAASCLRQRSKGVGIKRPNKSKVQHQNRHVSTILALFSNKFKVCCFLTTFYKLCSSYGFSNPFLSFALAKSINIFEGFNAHTRLFSPRSAKCTPPEIIMKMLIKYSIKNCWLFIAP